MKKLLFFFILVISSYCLFGKTKNQNDCIQPLLSPINDTPVIKMHVGNVVLHFTEQGKGEPVLLLHGGQGDYRSWTKQVEALAPRYRVITYSRRYHFPNENHLTPQPYNALTDAGDLAGFIDSLKLDRVHLIGTSYGAFTALAFAMIHPHRVLTMVLAEPPLLQWATTTIRGAELYHEFMNTVHNPAGKAFAAGDSTGALGLLINRFDGPGAFDALPPERKKVIYQNARFFQAITASPDPFPDLPREKIKNITLPVLVVRGANTKELDVLVSEEVLRTLPNAEKAVIPNAGHGSPRQNPEAFNAAVLGFLEKHRDKK
ncbi:alpha/beta hydrolase [Flavisolibacter sp. BT320]|nr:alpha/beta hydrolase [Flavisolibacter longurius]